MKDECPIKSGNLNGYIKNCQSTQINVTQITLTLDHQAAHRLCAALDDRIVQIVRDRGWIDDDGQATLNSIHEAISLMIDKK